MTRRNLLLMLLIFVASIAKAHDFEIDGIYYEHMSRADMTVAVSCKGNSWDASEEYSGNVVVPYTVSHNGEHYTVAAVRSYAFMGNTKLTSVSLPFTVKSIGNFSFSNCTALETIDFGGNVETIGENAFANCTALKEVDLPKTMHKIGPSIFYGCTSLTSAIVRGSMEEIPENAFYECANMTYFRIPFGVKKIGKMAFFNCRKLADIDLDEFMEEIGERCFENSGLERVILPTTMKKLGNGCFAYTKLGEITIPDGIKRIENAAFLQCESLRKVVVGTDANHDSDKICIAYRAFAYCKNLESVFLSNDVDTVGSFSFEHCDALKDLHLGSNIRIIEDRAFQYCSSLAEVSLPESLTEMEYGVFTNCSNLKKVTFGNALHTIGERAFSNCKALESINLPASIDSIGTCAFDKCYALASATLGKGLRVLEAGAFSNCSNLEEISIPDGCSEIKDRTFYYCKKLRKATLGNGIKSIGEEAFRECTALETVILPSGTKHIAKNCFYNCRNLTDINLDGNLRFIGASAFYATSISQLSFRNTLETIEAYAFDSCNKLQSVAIPATTKSISPDAFSRCQALKFIHVDKDNPAYCDIDGLLYTHGKDTLLIYPWAKGRTAIIPDGTKTVLNSAFFSSKATVLFLPSSCRKVEAWPGLYNLTVVWPISSADGIEAASLSKSALLFVSNGSEGNIKGKGAFARVRNVYGKTLMMGPDSIAYHLTTDTKGTPVAEVALNYGTYLTDYKCPETVEIGDKTYTITSIGEYAFSQNTGTLHSIELPSTLENIKEYAFGTVEKVTSGVLSPLPVSTDAFYSSTFSNAPLYVPAGTAGKYKSAEGWKKFYKIVEIAGTGIDEATVSAAEPYAVFDANGRRTNALKRGLNILRYGDGTVKKVIKK